MSRIPNAPASSRPRDAQSHWRNKHPTSALQRKNILKSWKSGTDLGRGCRQIEARSSQKALEMLRHTIYFLIVAVGAALAEQEEYSPFYDPVQYGRGQPLLLHKRQNCPTGYDSCSGLGSGGDAACCYTNLNCDFDDAGHVACCPSNAVCTGTIDGTIAYSVTTTTGVTAAVTGAYGGGGTVPNVFYPSYTYMPTGFANAGVCSSAWTACQSQSTSCFVAVAGQNGVTVAGVAGGITQLGVTGTALSSASSICSSLSERACYNLQETNCAQFSNGAGGVTVAANAGRPRQTACPGMVYAIGAGAVVGAAGALIP